MKPLPVIFSPEAEEQLEDLRQYIACQASAQVANGYIDRILAHCEKLSNIPHWGTPHNELQPGVRTISFERRTTIAYRILDQRVEVIAIAHGGRDLARLLR